MHNIIIKGRDNPVILEFTFTGDFETNGLNTFDYITLSIDNESYSTQDADNKLTITDLIINDEVKKGAGLELNIGDSTNLPVGYYTPAVIGYSPTYDDGYVLNSDDKRELQALEVK